MNEFQIETFIYSCQKESLKLHFNNKNDGVARYMFNKGEIEDKTFIQVITEQKQLLDGLGTGVCFNMAAWVMELLYSMDIDEFYFMESENGYWSNFVVLFNTHEGYKICDLAAEVRKNEELISSLVDAEKEELQDLQNRIKNPANLIQTPEQYVKEYPIELCTVLQHQGNENTLYYEVPRIGLKEFLAKQNSSKKSPNAH